MQIERTNKQMLNQALNALGQSGKKRSVGLDLIALALRGKKVDMSKVITMIDDMVVLLGKEQQDDDHKKEYCTLQFDMTDDKKKELERTVSDLEKTIDEDKEMVETLKGEIATLKDGILHLDREVAGATMQRKEEHEDVTAELTANKAASEIIDFAKNRMNKFYNPKLYKPPPKKELTEEERIAQNMGAASFADRGVAPPPPPPAAPGAYKKKGEESGGVIQMMDNLKADLQKEITEMEVTEQNAQEDYEQMVKDAADKRAADTVSVEEKEFAKAQAEAEVVKLSGNKAAVSDELMATEQYIMDLHAECDWLLENFETRKEARATEIQGLKDAKAVLSGADYSFIQLH